MTSGTPTDNGLRERTAVSASTLYGGHAHTPWLWALALVMITLAAYQPVQDAGFIWDDDTHVMENANLRSCHGLYRIWFEPLAAPQYYPLQLTSFWIEYHLWGLWPFGYHAVNVLLHALNAVLLWIVLQQLNIPGAWLAAAVFAVHPVQVESVAWVTELKNLLSTTFYLGAMLAFFRFQPLTVESSAGSPPGRYGRLTIALFLCALLSKTVTCSLPAVLVLLIWWKRGRVRSRDIEVLGPMFLLGITVGLTTAWLEKYHVGANGAEWSLSFLQRCLLAGRALWFYVGKLFWPYPLIFNYPHWEVDPTAWWQYLFPAAAAVVLLALWLLRSRIGRGPLVAALCFGCTLFPSLGFFDLYPFRYSYVADHFQYLACIGVISLVVSAGTAICQRTVQWGRDLGTVVAAIMLLILGVTTWRQVSIYQDSETLWRDTLAKNSDSCLAHVSLGLILEGQGNVQEAIGHYEQALRINPDYTEAHNCWGGALLQLGRAREAVTEYEKALRINPNYLEAHSNLGVALLQLGKVQEAIGHLDQALSLKPDCFQAQDNWGNALLQAGKVREAIGHYEQALRINPDYAEGHYNLGNALEQAGRVQEAIGHYEQALRIKPDLAQAQNALARLQAGQ